MNVQDFTDELIKETAYYLASRAGCQSPDSLESPGAEWLAHVRDEMIRAIADGRIMWEGDGAQVAAPDDRGDVIHGIADEAVPIYTYRKWTIFTDLCAWQRADEVAEDMGTPDGMDRWADLCLFGIAEELCRNICESLDKDCAEDGI